MLDTNVLVAAFVSRGHCHELMEYAIRLHEVFTSEFILMVFRRALTEKLRIPKGTVEKAASLTSSRMQVVDPAPLPEPVCRDSDDDMVLATAVTAEASCLITGDGDLLTLGSYRTVRILSPAAFWRFETEDLES